MKTFLMALAATAATLATITAKADEYQDMAQFAQSICGDIPSGTLSKTTIKGAVQANATVLARILTGSGDLSADTVREVYEGIPLDNLPDQIPTVAMCKSELVKALLNRKKIVANKCRHEDFGQEGWKRTETYADSSGRLGGGHDQPWWCNQVAASFISSRRIGPHEWKTIKSDESSKKDWKGHVTYKYYCTIKINWDPLYFERQDASRCGTHEE